MPSSQCHHCLINETILFGTDVILQQLTAEHTAARKQAIRQAIRLAILRYAEGAATISQQLNPTEQRSA